MIRRRHLSVPLLVAVTAAPITYAVSSASAAPAPRAAATAAAAPAVPAGLSPVVTRTSLTGSHAWYAQTYRGLPVLGAYYARHTYRDGTVSVDDGRQSVPATLSVSPRVSATTASSSARSAVVAKAAATARSASARPAKDTPTAAVTGSEHATLAVVGGAQAALVWSVVSTSDAGTTRTLVDARTGAVRSVTSLTKNADGSGKVFDPNPVVTLRNESLKDKGDKDQAVLNPAYKSVALQDLNAGTRTLVGAYAQVVKAYGGLATSTSRSFVYTRADDRFEQVNAYYGIDQAQRYIQSLGFTDVNNESQKLKIDTYAGDNSFYDPSNDTITYGRGGVDDAEDLEVVWHEYGHAIQDAQVPGYGSSEQAGATGEGFGDYWAVTMSQPVSAGFDLPCVMDWDSTSYTPGPVHCLRRTDTGKTVADLDGEVHDDGEIWSNALWDINKALGRDKANTLILEAQFSYSPGNSFKQAATTTVATAKRLYGQATANKVKAAFAARDIL